MITLKELKNYLDIVETDKDGMLQGFINTAISQLDSLCNRTLLKRTHTENVYSNSSRNIISLRNAPINSISSFQYWNGSVYSNMFVLPATIENSLILNHTQIFLKDSGYYFRFKDFLITYNAGYKFQTGTGKITVTGGSPNVVGTNGTIFQTEIQVGDYLSFEGERIKVISISTNTGLILESPAAYGSISVFYNISNVPEDLRQGCKELAAKLYYDSGIGQSLLLKSNESKSGTESSKSVTYKELNEDVLINNYRFVNV